MKANWKMIQGLFLAVLFLLVAGCSDDKSIPLALPSDDGSASKASQEQKIYLLIAGRVKIA